ncbi:MAG: STAS-like domain-containing protein [Lysobacterales bacterium]
MNKEHIFTDTDLASRHSAAKLRNDIDALLDEGSVVLNFSQVLVVSESYADELIGVLVEQRGLAPLFERLQLRGVRSNVARSIAAAVRQRLTLQTSGDDTLALLAAKEALARQKAARAAL